MGRGRLRPEVHGSPPSRQGRGFRCGHGWCVRGRQARGSKEKQEVVSNRLLAAHNGDGAPPEETRRVQEMLGRDVVEGPASQWCIESSRCVSTQTRQRSCRRSTHSIISLSACRQAKVLPQISSLFLIGRRSCSKVCCQLLPFGGRRRNRAEASGAPSVK